VASEKSSLLEIALKAAIAAGDVLMDRPHNFHLATKSSSIDFATQKDVEAEKLIVSTILAQRSGDGVIGEEGASKVSESGITWVIDPLDGTVNYFYGLPGWAISIGARDEIGGVVGVVYAPTLNLSHARGEPSFTSGPALEGGSVHDSAAASQLMVKKIASSSGVIWYATRGGGAFCNGERINCSQESDIESSLLGTGFSYSRQIRIEQGANIARLIPRCRDIRRLGAAAIDLCHVGMGSLDGYFEIGLKEWDLAAGMLIAQEAGALVTGDGLNPDSMVIAANPGLHRKLSEFLAPKP
jgi:myo-inositol-1(or 4)-monophosphatase